jgi:hypothetical protein
MKKALRNILPAIGMLSILMFCVSATAGFAASHAFVSQTFSEPINILLIGFGLIGFGNFIRRKNVR